MAADTKQTNEITHLNFNKGMSGNHKYLNWHTSELSVYNLLF